MRAFVSRWTHMYAPTGMIPDSEWSRRSRNSLRARNDEELASLGAGFTAVLSDRKASQPLAYGKRGDAKTGRFPPRKQYRGGGMTGNGVRRRSSFVTKVMGGDGLGE